MVYTPNPPSFSFLLRMTWHKRMNEIYLKKWDILILSHLGEQIVTFDHIDDFTI